MPILTLAAPSKEYQAELAFSEATMDKGIANWLYVALFAGLVTVIVGAITSAIVKEVEVKFIFPAASVA